MRFRLTFVVMTAALTATNGYAQRAEKGNLDLIGDVVFVVAAEEEKADDEVDGSREVTVEVKRDGKSVTVTQTVDGEFVGEIVEGDETTEIRAKSLNELKEKSPEAHAAFHDVPKPPKPGEAQATSVSVADNDGDRKIEIQEPGRKVTMRDQRGKQIGITVRQTLEHGQRIERVDAADMESLKKIAPELARLAEQYAAAPNVAANVRVQTLPGRVGRNGAPAGPRKISGEHNGGKIVIRDDGGKDIRITLTKTIDGKEVVDEIKADDFDSLKKQNPELAAVYEKLAGKGGPQVANQFNNGNIIIGNAGARIQLQAQPVPIQAAPDAGPAPPAPPVREFVQLKAVMKLSKKKLERMANDPEFVDQEAAKKLIEDIDGVLDQLKELEAKVKP